MVTYFVLCCHLRDYIEENVDGTKFNYHKIKLLTNQLSKELEQSINIVFAAKEFSKEDKDAMLENYINAVQTMTGLFKIGLALQYINSEDALEFSIKVTELAKSYGIERD